MDKELGDALSELSESMKEARDEFDKRNESWWNALSEEERENAFYAVVKRINQAENIDKRSFRGALYGVFGFGPEMYGTAMDAGYMNVHNAIFDGNEFMEMTQANELIVVGPDNTQVTWPEVESLAIELQDNKVVVKLNQGSHYV